MPIRTLLLAVLALLVAAPAALAGSPGKWTQLGDANLRNIDEVALARGMVGREKCGLMPIRGHSGVQGGAEVGCVPDKFPGGDVDETRAAALERSSPGQCVGCAMFEAECLRRMRRVQDARAACFAGLDEIEQTDHIYRDSNRVCALLILSRIALDQADAAAAHAACTQAVAHLQGRPRTLGGGWLMIRALAGLARSGGGEEPYGEATALFERRDRYNFSWLPLLSQDAALLAAQARGEVDRVGGELRFRDLVRRR